MPSVLASFVVVSLSSSSLAEAEASGPEGWLQQQPVVAWLSTFLLTRFMASYWRRALPPAQWWPEQRAAQGSSPVRNVFGYAVVIGLSIAAALAVRAWVAEVFQVRTSSMLPGLAPGDWVVVDKLPRTLQAVKAAPGLPARGSVVLFATPDPALRELDAYLVKRVIGLPGDVLTLEQGVPTINGWRIPRCSVGHLSLQPTNVNAPIAGTLSVEWLGDATYLTLAEGVASQATQGPYTVKNGEIWVLGDNRNNSADSRTWFNGRGGGVPIGAISGLGAWAVRGHRALSSLSLSRVRSPKLPLSAAHLQPSLERCLATKPDRTVPSRVAPLAAEPALIPP